MEKDNKGPMLVLTIVIVICVISLLLFVIFVCYRERCFGEPFPSSWAFPLEDREKILQI